MQLDFTQLAPLDAYRWLASTVTPRPIAWVSTLSQDGISNLAPFSFFQVISDNPPTQRKSTTGERIEYERDGSDTPVTAIGLYWLSELVIGIGNWLLELVIG